jgi:hypothetical protein
MRARQGLIAATEAGVRIIGRIHMPWAGAILLSQGHRSPQSVAALSVSPIIMTKTLTAHGSTAGSLITAPCAGRTARAALASAIVP